ncbi:MAG: AhpC/TSA family protein [Syntrophus sp. PtaU1.Bin005]|jgi:peroxiredoxin Q/BCP|nr:MAG: AhpC/TSA family protein [Syntrophus sp. PtaU1.Bin005]
MAQLRRDYQEFLKRDAEVIAIGPEKPEPFAEWWRSHDMPFIGLPDPDHSVSRRYGQQVKLLKLGRLPAQLVIDKRGLIRYAHYGSSMSDIPENKEILAILDQLAATA